MIRFNLVIASFLFDIFKIVIWTTLSDNKISQCQKKTSKIRQFQVIKKRYPLERYERYPLLRYGWFPLVRYE
jgi:hypothetical protein